MTKILDLISQPIPEDMTDTELKAALYNCTGCGNEVSEDDKLTGILLHPEHGWIVFPPEQLCSKCLGCRIKDYDKNFKVSA